MYTVLTILPSPFHETISLLDRGMPQQNSIRIVQFVCLLFNSSPLFFSPSHRLFFRCHSFLPVPGLIYKFTYRDNFISKCEPLLEPYLSSSLL